MGSKLKHLCKTRTFNVEKAKRVLGWKANVDIDEAIEKSVKWGLAKLAGGNGSGKAKDMGEALEDVRLLDGKDEEIEI